MNPPSKYQSLFLTPRSPNGKRLHPHALRRHMGASENRWPVSQEGPDQLKQRADNQRMMDQNDVPRSLQGEISPQRAGEITDPSRKPLPAPQIPGMTNKVFPYDAKRPPSSQVSPQAHLGSGVLRPASTGGQTPNMGGADKALGQKPQEMPFQKYYEGIPLPGGWKLGPDNDSFRKGGGGFQLTPPWWQTPPKNNAP